MKQNLKLYLMIALLIAVLVLISYLFERTDHDHQPGGGCCGAVPADPAYLRAMTASPLVAARIIDTLASARI